VASRNAMHSVSAAYDSLLILLR